MTRAELHTTVPDPDAVAAAIRPDNTDQITTTTTDEVVVTTITREDTSGLQATVDDYLINLTVATDILADHDPGTNARDDSPTTTSESDHV